jgi:hypothetical protein
MRERIETLMKQAGTDTSGKWMGVDHIEKLVELVAKECMDLALIEQKRYAEFTHRNLSECAVTMSNFRLLLKEHFGVKE